MGLDITEINADDASAVAAYVEIRNTVEALDAPWQPPIVPHRQALFMRHGWDGEPSHFFLGYDGDQSVAALAVHTSTYDNLDAAWHDLRVHPEHRRKGHGLALIGFADDFDRSLGRTSLGYDAWDGSDARAFATAIGSAQKSQAINRRMALREVPEQRIAELHASAERASGDYELARILGYTPEDLLQPLADAAAAINDAPLDDLELEDEKFTVDRVRAYERAQELTEHRVYRVVARHRETGEIAGHSVVAVNAADPEYADQHDTSVVRTHRGHRLGLLLKAEMVRWLREAEPDVGYVDTWNAESNDHVIAVNEQLGYRVLGRGLLFQRRLDR